MSVSATSPLTGPKGGYFGGAAATMRRDQLGFYESCAREYGDVVETRLGPYRVLLIYHPDAIEELLVARNRDFIKSRGVRLLRPLLGNGLFLAEGDSWLRQRRLLQPAFHRQRVAGYGEVMSEITEHYMARWHDGQEVDANEEMMRLHSGSSTRIEARISVKYWNVSAAILPGVSFLRRRLIAGSSRRYGLA